MRAEKLFLRPHELAAGEVASQRPRLGGAAQVERDRDADDRDPDELEAVAEPPAELVVAQEHRRRKRGGQPGDPDEDEQVSVAMREQEGAKRTPGERAVEDEADGEERQRRRAAGLGDGRNELRVGDGEHAETEDSGQEETLDDEENANGRTPELRDGGKREDRAADRQGGAAGERDDAVVAHQDVRGRDPVQGEECCHHGERGPDQDCAAVVAPRAHDRQDDRGDGRCQRGQADAAEVEHPSERDLVASEEVPGRRRECRHRSAKHEDRSDPIAGTTPHASQIIGMSLLSNLPLTGD